MPPDYRASASSETVAADLARARPGDIVCLHENAAARPRTPDLVEAWLKRAAPGGRTPLPGDNPGVAAAETG